MKKIILVCTLLLTLQGISQEIKFGKISKQDLEEKFYPTDSSANAAYLYRKRKTNYVYRKGVGFQVISEFFFRIKIYNKEGFDHANFNLVYYDPESGDKEKISSIKGYTFNLDDNGEVSKTKLTSKSIFDEQVNKYRSAKKISMPDVKEGAVIDLQYKLISPYRTIIDDLTFQTGIPIKKLYTKIEIPEWFIFNKMTKGYYNVPVKSSTKNGSISFTQRVRHHGAVTVRSTVQNAREDLRYNIDEFIATNIPALKDNEPFISNVKNYYGGLKYELAMIQFPNSSPKPYTNTWENVSKQIYQSKGFGRELEKNNYFKDDLAAILSATEGDVQKAIAIFEHVKNKVKWNNYYGKYVDEGVKSAYKNGSGNAAEINLILTAMLRAAGLGANPVLVSTRNHGIPLYPTLDGFNYVVTYVEFPNNGGTMLLDATEPYATPNVLPVRALNWNGRKVTKEGYSEWVNLSPPKHASETNTLKAKIDTEGNITGLLRKNESMLNALLTRKRYNHLEEDALISKLEEKYNIEIENFRFNNKKKLNKAVSQMLKFSSEDLVEGINNKLLFNPLLFLTKETNPFKSNDRKFPVDFGSAWKETNNVSIEIPEGYTVESIPEQLAIGLPDNLGFFKCKVTNTGNIIKVNAVMQINAAIITPKYYASLKDFYAKVVAKQNENIVLIKG
ncbi:transglutaminase domain-containing protein [Tenacibaculum amylolyticum]|uniref:transglutaminase domain-containing protein n=1 Tax=Tenacibaculum amylolyticum TaxID=104269 RepID=UPI003895AC05